MASELRADLKRLRRDTTSGQSAVHATAVRVAPRRPGIPPWALGGAAALALAGGIGWWLTSGRTPEASPPVEPLQTAPFTSDGGYKDYPELSRRSV